ncbi:MAG TPA: hypothetical protein VJZ93_01160 [Candidatus Nanoarchaeia archaeon]|nr:hypothetical protein [Candidatus Nanoarchaeia archaeon]
MTQNNSNLESLVKEIGEHIEEYPRNLKELSKAVVPAFVAGTIGGYAGQKATGMLTDNLWLNTFGGYIGGSILGYPTFFGIEFFRNRDNYRGKEGMKKFGKFVQDFVIADYLTDFMFFTPFYTLFDQIAQRNGIESGDSAAIAFVGAGAIYTLAIPVTMPVISRINNKVNSLIKEGYHKLNSFQNIK